MKIWAVTIRLITLALALTLCSQAIAGDVLVLIAVLLLIYVAYLAIVVAVYLGVRSRLASRGNGPHPATR